MTSPTAGSAGPRRQERGRQRMEQILRAAAEVFAERAYEGATTNAIAERAGISPGSLYQFFSSKDDIARGLADLYIGQLREARKQAFDDADLAGRPLGEVVAAVVGPLVAFNLAHPGFKALFARTDMPEGLRLAVEPIHAEIHDRVRALVQAVVPDLGPADVDRAATVVIQLVRGLMPLIVAADEPARELLVADLNRLLVGYVEGLSTA